MMSNYGLLKGTSFAEEETWNYPIIWSCNKRYISRLKLWFTRSGNEYTD